MLDVTITSLETITAFAIGTGDYLFTLDELQSATINQTQEKQEITGKKGRKLSSMKRNKAVTISGNNGIVSCGLLELQTGCEFESKKTKVMWTDYLTVNADHEATTNYIAYGTAGAEIKHLFLKGADGVLGNELEQAAEVAAGKFTYTPGTKKLTFHTNIAANTEIVVYYERQITADVLTNESDKYSGKCQLYVDAIGEDKCANLYRVQIYIPKADFNGEFSFEMGDNQTVHAFEAEALSGACGLGGALWTFTVFGADAADVGD